MLILLVACVDPKEPPAEGADTADTDTAPDFGDTSRDTSGYDAAEWPATLAAPDIRIASCGSSDKLGRAVAVDGDLDGDGLPEVAVGAPGHDEVGEDFGAVYVFLGSQVGGAVDAADAFVTLRATHARTDGGMADPDQFGLGLQWLGDIDGDGADELLVRRGDYGFAVFRGSDLLVGGILDESVAAATFDDEATVVVRYPDLDGDSVGDFALGRPNRGMSEAVGYRGALALVSGPALLDATLPKLHEVYGLAADAHLGSALTTFPDEDGDGFPELATLLGDQLVIVGSAAVRGRALYADDTLLSAWDAAAGFTDLYAVGDADGGGRTDLVLSHEGLYPVSTEGTAGMPRRAFDCGGRCDAAALAPDLDGDGAADLWVVYRSVYGVSSRDLLAGTASVSAPLATVDLPGYVYPALVSGADGLWVGVDGEGDPWPSGGLARVDVAAGDTTSVDAATATVRSGYAMFPDLPRFADLTGDGLDEAVFLGEGWPEARVFDGATLAAGGDFTVCDADYRTDATGSILALLEDADGDGAAEVLWKETDGAGDTTLTVEGGASFLGLAADDTRTVASVGDVDGEWYLVPACDVTGDGRVDFALYDGDGGDLVLVDGAAWVHGYTVADHLGAFPGGTGMGPSPAPACLADIDGDGGGELLWGYPVGVYRSSDLDPARAFAAADRWAVLDSDDALGEGLEGYPVPVRDLDGDGLVEHVVASGASAGGHPLVRLDGATLAAGGAIDADALPVCLQSEGEDRWILVLGNVGPDVAVLGYDERAQDYVVYGVRGDDLAAGISVSAGVDAPVLFDPEERVGDIAWDGITLGPDLRGSGLRSFVVRWEAAGTGRSTVAVILGG